MTLSCTIFFIRIKGITCQFPVSCRTLDLLRMCENMWRWTRTSRALLSMCRGVARSLSFSRTVAQAQGTLYKRNLLMTQFEKVKQQYPQYILLFQVGDFYEIYGDDAGTRYTLHLSFTLSLLRMCESAVSNLANYASSKI